MLEPKKVKFRKPHRPRVPTKATRCLSVSFGEYGLKSVSSGWITNRSIEAARRVMVRYIRKGGKIWIRVFPDRIITAKPNIVPMGKGKGTIDRYVADVKRGQVLFEISGVSRDKAIEALTKAGHKVKVRTKVVSRMSIV